MVLRHLFSRFTATSIWHCGQHWRHSLCSFLPSLRLDCRRPPHEPKRFAFRKLHRKMSGTARSGKWALGLRCTTSAYRTFKSFGRRFRTALPIGLIFDCCGRLKTLVQNDGARHSVSFELSLHPRRGRECVKEKGARGRASFL